jgi:DNA modification methylase
MDDNWTQGMLPMTTRGPRGGATEDEILSIAARHVPELDGGGPIDQSFIPALAKSPERMEQVRAALDEVHTYHRLQLGDARDLGFLDDESVHLVVTSPPYWILKEYPEGQGQLGNMADYEHFLEQLRLVWQECFRVLVPGSRLVIVVGDVCLSRRSYGRHVVFPLHASIQELCREIGFDNLSPIIWYKIANAQFEAGGGGFLGKPYEPNGIIKNDIEYILMQRKPGAYRKPTTAMRVLSTIAYDEHKEWFKAIWTIPGASTKDHPAPYPVELAERLVRMFSFAGDTVLDPFVGSGSTPIASALAARNSIGVDINQSYLDLAAARFKWETVGHNSHLVESGRGEPDHG